MEDRIHCGTLMVENEDHTLGNILRMQLLKDKTIKFAGYRMPHPLEPKVEVKVQTTNEKAPVEAIKDACEELCNHIRDCESSFDQAFAEFKG